MSATIRAGFASICVAICCATVGDAQETPEAAYESARARARDNAESKRQGLAGYTFEQFLATVYKEPFPGGVYIVNGDTAIANEKLLREFYNQNVRAKPRERSGDVPEFIIGVVGALDSIWSDAEKQALNYCVSTQFGSRHDRVVADLEMATRAWEAFAAIDFIHVPAEDAACTASNANVAFDVRPVRVFGEYYARAFSPSYPREQRNLLIDQSAFRLPRDKPLQLVGVLRHEIGHAIGARHEHTHPDAGACFEDPNWRPVTSYDAFSVMHYPECNDRANRELQLSVKDKNGAACIYGAAPGFDIDRTICTPAASTSRVQRRVYERETIALNEEKTYRFSVAGGTPFLVVMRGVAPMPGDPDLYVKFDRLADRLVEFDCRPFGSGPDEICAVDVPAAGSVAHVLVHGYTAGNYRLNVTYTAPLAPSNGEVPP